MGTPITGIAPMLGGMKLPCSPSELGGAPRKLNNDGTLAVDAEYIVERDLVEARDPAILPAMEAVSSAALTPLSVRGGADVDLLAIMRASCRDTRCG